MSIGDINPIISSRKPRVKNKACLVATYSFFTFTIHIQKTCQTLTRVKLSFFIYIIQLSFKHHFTTAEAYLNPQERYTYKELYKVADAQRKMFLGKQEGLAFLSKAGIPKELLEEVMI